MNASVFKIIVLGILVGIAAAFILSNLPDKNFVLKPIEQKEVVRESVATNTTTEPILPQPKPETFKPEPEAPKLIEVAVPEIKVAEIIPEVPATPVTISSLLPPINEDEIKLAVARIRCGFTFGSGFIIKRDGKYYAITVAHVVINQIESKNYTCDVILPRKDENGNFKETYYRKGTILSPAEIEKNYKEQAIDLAVLKVLPLEDRQEDLRIFPTGYPYVNYSFCPADTLGDNIILLGYAANLGTTITPGAFLSKFTGEIVQYSDVTGVKARPSTDFISGLVYLPVQEPSFDTNISHQITIFVSDNNFSGASGGLVFNTSKNCIAGVNFGTLLQNGNVFGFSTNPNFEKINNWLETIIK